jgi:hypothetical protein
MDYFTVEQHQVNRDAIRKSIALLTNRLNQMEPEVRGRAEKTILNLRGQVQTITKELEMAGAK